MIELAVIIALTALLVQVYGMTVNNERVAMLMGLLTLFNIATLYVIFAYALLT